MEPCHACNGPHLVWYCNESICNWCRPNLDSHTPAKYTRKRPLDRQQKPVPSYNNNSTRSQSNGHYDPNVQLSVSTSKPDHITKLLEATKKMTKYFKKSYKHNKHTMTVLTVTTLVATSTTQLIQTNTNTNLMKQMIKYMKLLVKHIHLKLLNHNPKIRTLMTSTVWIVTLTLLQAQNDYHKLTKLLSQVKQYKICCKFPHHN